MQQIMNHCRNADPGVRESYLHIFVFLPTCFDGFEKYFPVLMDIFMQGFADEMEQVRKLCLRIMKICISYFARTSPRLILQHLL